MIDLGLLLLAISVALLLNALCGFAVAYLFWRTVKIIAALNASAEQSLREASATIGDLDSLTDDLDGLAEELRDTTNLLACTASKRANGKLRLIRPHDDEEI